MTAATIAPALNHVATPAPPRRIEPETQKPQHLLALDRANEVRLARAALKRRVAAGSADIIEIVLECPWEAESMKIGELLASQRRWGRARARKLVLPLRMSENKELGSLTERQRKLLAAALMAKTR
jgi:hypothetical protein